MNTESVVTTFFDRYASALLARDAEAVAELYAVPALVLFPGQSIAVTDRAQTATFFAQSWSQYDGIDEATPAIDVLAATEHSIWADVTWSYGGAASERFVYQLTADGGDWRISVLTPVSPA